MITHIRGILQAVGDEELTLHVEPFEFELLVPDYARRRLQDKIGQPIGLHTMFYIEGNQMGGKMTPRLVGFLSPIDREFFDVFCSVDGVGARKALRAMTRPVRELARLIQDQDVRMLATFPGIGEALAERIVAKLRRKVGKFALIVGEDVEAPETAEVNGHVENAEPDVIRDAFAALISVGHSESQARQAIDRALATSKKKFRSLPDLIEAIYHMRDRE